MHRFIKLETFHIGQTIFLEREQKHHMQRVLRISSGDLVELINKKGQIAHCKAVDSQELIVEKVESKKRVKHKKILVMGLCHPNKLELLVEKACELGVDEVIIYKGEKSSIKALSSSKLKRLETIRDSALKQSKRVWDMKISIAETIFSLDYSDKKVYFASIHAKIPYEATSESTMIIVGPESGFGPKELSFFKEQAFQAISLSRHILRAESAAIISSFLLSQ